MKRSLKALLVAGAAAAALVGPSAAPAHAQDDDICAGIWLDPDGHQVGAWSCTCPPLYQFPGDGHFHVVVCLPPPR